MTLDKLALMTGRGFNEVHDKMNRGFAEVNDKMNKGFAEINERFEGVDKKFEGVDKRFEGIEARLDRIEIKLDSLERRIFAIENILTEHGKDIRELKNEVKKIRELGDVGHEKILELEQRVKVLEDKIIR